MNENRMEHTIYVEKVGDDVCLFHNVEIVYKENVYAEDYAYTMVRDKERDLRKELGVR